MHGLILRVLMMFASFASFGFGALAFGGNDSSGGGSLLLRAGKKVALDLYFADPRFDDEEGKTTAVDETPLSQKLRLDNLDPAKEPGYRFALDKVRRWETLSPVITSFIEDALRDKLNFLFTPESLARYRGFYVPKAFEKEKLETFTVIRYDRVLGPVVNAAHWKETGKTSRASFYVHESLRRLQALAPRELTDERIQKLTARIILEDPEKTKKTLETQELLGKRLFDVVRNVPVAEYLSEEPMKKSTRYSGMKDVAENLTERLRFSNLREHFTEVRNLVETLPESEKLLPLVDELKNGKVVFTIPLANDGYPMSDYLEKPNYRHSLVSLNAWMKASNNLRVVRGAAAKQPKLVEILDELLTPAGTTYSFLWPYGGPPTLYKLSLTTGFFDNVLDDLEKVRRRVDVPWYAQYKELQDRRWGRLRETYYEPRDLSWHYNDRLRCAPTSGCREPYEAGKLRTSVAFYRDTLTKYFEKYGITVAE